MRLINTRTLELQDFSLLAIPPYAILSHTWGDSEVSFRDMSLPSRFSKIGFEKIVKTCQLAREYGLGFAWVDTCCIDKSSSAELTESISSMWQYYINAAVCYVSLGDLQPNTPVNDGLAYCRWFTRGWTLQELIAPKKLEFYDMSWTYRGSKFDFIHSISSTTGIPTAILRGEESLASFSIAERMSWAARRQTTRVEDTAYCLLGIFDVNMPLIYGEGIKSFRRLQEEIIKRLNDMTIFAWNSLPNSGKQVLGLFATSPAAFIDSSHIVPFIDDFLEHSVTNKGLFMAGDRLIRVADVSRGNGDHEILQYLICFGRKYQNSYGIPGIYLRKVGPNLFYRDGMFSLAGFGPNLFNQKKFINISDYHILVDPNPAIPILHSKYRDTALHVPINDIFTLEDTVPENLWDFTDRIFLRPSPYIWAQYPTALAMVFRTTITKIPVDIVVLCDFRGGEPVSKVFDKSQYSREASMLFEGRYRHESIYWADLELQAPDIFFLTNKMKLRCGNRNQIFSVSFEKGIIESISENKEVFSLKFNVA
jgi:hypothetical protein